VHFPKIICFARKKVPIPSIIVFAIIEFMNVRGTHLNQQKV
jgi:hypothetical protein